jgi:hypothetical protein
MKFYKKLFWLWKAQIIANKMWQKKINPHPYEKDSSIDLVKYPSTYILTIWFNFDTTI